MSATVPIAEIQQNRDPAPMPPDQLLRAALRRSAASDGKHLSHLAARVDDWNVLLRLAREHRIAPMLFCRLRHAGVTLPPGIEDHLRAEYHRNALQGLANASELIAVLREFERASIPGLPFKGVVLAASVYGDLTTRPAGDLDLLIRWRDLPRATTIVLNRGFRRTTPVRADGRPTDLNSYEYHFERPSDGMQLELRWRLELTQPRFRRRLGLDWAWPGRGTASLAGATVPNMSPEIGLLMLCMHGCKHFWSRLIWIGDVAQMIESSPSLDWEQVLREARRTGLGRALALGVLLAHDVARAEIPEKVLRRFQANRSASALARHIADNLFTNPGSAPPGRVPYNIRLLDFRDRIRFLLSFEFLRPNAQDRESISLPRALYPLYFLIRPFRLLRDKSAR